MGWIPKVASPYPVSLCEVLVLDGSFADGRVRVIVEMCKVGESVTTDW